MERQLIDFRSLRAVPLLPDEEGRGGLAAAGASAAALSLGQRLQRGPQLRQVLASAPSARGHLLVHRECLRPQNESLFEPSNVSLLFAQNEGECGKGDASRCGRSQGCCSDYCCDKKYADAFAKLPCDAESGLGNSFCQSMRLGDYCCPAKGGSPNASATCCDTNPNPPTQSPSVGDGRGAASMAAAALPALAVSALLGLILA